LALIDQRYQSVPLQVEARDRWSDRSLKWGLLHFRATIAAWQAIAYRLHYPSDYLRHQMPGVSLTRAEES
jgi:hypothetical protein